jgi:NSS family neurotransmitter:Na+ symporter
MVENNQWDSSLSFILAMIGAAVGLGNIWRFSYVLYSNGGGSFFIPYLVAIGLMGIPFLILEYGMGFSFKDSFTNIFKKINPKFEFLSWILILLVFGIVIYYVVIISWDFIYLLSSFIFAWGNDPASYFVTSVGGSSNVSNFSSILLPTFLGVLLMWFVVWFISHKDLNNGIGRFSKILIPTLFIMMAIIIIYSISLPGADIGINTLLNPNWAGLMDVNIWLAAFSQIVFSLSLGQAIALSYASYLPENSKLSDNVLIVVASNSLFEVFTAFGIFSILGYMSLTSGMPMVQLISEGTGLIFIVFPMVFNVMGSVGHIFAPILFIAVLFAGLTSAVAIFEPMVNSTLHKFGWSRKKTVTILSIIGCAISLLFTTKCGSYLIEIVDSFINNFGIIILIAIQCIVFTWFYDMDSLIPIINENNKFKVGKLWKLIVKYILPIFLIVMWIIGVYDLVLNADSFKHLIYAIIAIVVLLLSFILTKINSKT